MYLASGNKVIKKYGISMTFSVYTVGVYCKIHNFFCIRSYKK